MNAINEINPNKSQGPDEIHPLFTLECKVIMCNVLTKLYKKSLQEGKLPY